MDEEEMLLAAEWDTFMEVEQQMELEHHQKVQNNYESRRTRNHSGTSTPDIFADNFDSRIREPLDQSAVTNRISNLSSDSNRSVFDEMDIDAHLDALDEQIQRNAEMNCFEHDSNQLQSRAEQNQEAVLGNDVKSIAQLNNIRNNVTSGKFRVRAQFDCVVRKLSANDEGWCIKLRIKDEDETLEVWLDSSIVLEIIGFDTKSIPLLRSKLLEENQSTEKFLLGVSSMIPHFDLMKNCFPVS